MVQFGKNHALGETELTGSRSRFVASAIFGLMWAVVFALPAGAGMLDATVTRPLDNVVSGLKQVNEKLTGSWEFAMYEQDRKAGSFRLRISADKEGGKPAYRVEITTDYTAARGERQVVDIRGTMTPDLQLVAGTRVEQRFAADGSEASKETADLSVDGKSLRVRITSGSDTSDVRMDRPERLYFGMATLFAAARLIDLTNTDISYSFTTLSSETLRVQRLMMRVVRRAMRMEDKGLVTLMVADSAWSSAPLLEFTLDAAGNVVRFGPPGGGVVFRKVTEK